MRDLYDQSLSAYKLVAAAIVCRRAAAHDVGRAAPNTVDAGRGLQDILPGPHGEDCLAQQRRQAGPDAGRRSSR